MFTQKYLQLRPLRFYQNKNFAARATGARGRNLQIFWNWPPKNIPDQQKRVAFRKSQKNAKSLHPIVQ